MDWGILMDAVSDATKVIIYALCIAAPLSLLVEGMLQSLRSD